MRGRSRACRALSIIALVALGTNALSGCELSKTPVRVAIRSQQSAAIRQPVPVRVGVVDPNGSEIDFSSFNDVRGYRWSLLPSTGATLTQESPVQMSFVATEPGIWVVNAVTTNDLVREWEIESGLGISGGPLRGEQTISVGLPLRPQSLVIETTIENYDLAGHSCPGVVGLTFVLADGPPDELPELARRASIHGQCFDPEVTAFEAQGTFDQRGFDLEGGRYETFGGTLDGGVVTIAGGLSDQTFTFMVER